MDERDDYSAIRDKDLKNKALSLGIRDDEVIATILLHDVCEDCGEKGGCRPGIS